MSEFKVIPCSGIGKVFGLLARETALYITDVLASETTETACLAHLVTGDTDAKAKVAGKQCITVDGCPALCAAKSVEEAGGEIVEKYRIVDEMRNHRGVNAGDGTALTEDGWRIVESFAAKINDKAKEVGGHV